MTILSLIVGLIKLAQSLAQYAGDRQLISAGEAKAIAAGTQATMERLEDARKGRDAMLAGDGGDAEWLSRVRDKYTRH